MVEWTNGYLIDITEIVMGQSPKGDSCNSNSMGTPLLNGPTEYGIKHPYPTQFTEDPKRFSKKNDILFCVRGSTTGRMNWADQEYAIGRGIAAIRHKEGDSYRHFIRGIFDYNLPLMLASATGSTFPNISKTQLEKLEILIPSLPEQKAIASVLSSLDDKIDLLHRQNNTLESMAETLFRQWFIEEAEDDWEQRKLGDLVTITRGASPRPIVKYVTNGTVPWLKIADATSSPSFFLNSTREFIIEEGVSKSVKVFPGDLILSNSATCGLPIFVELTGCIHDGWLLFRDFDILSEKFLFFFLKQINRHLNSIADGSVQNNLNTGLLKNYDLLLPPTSKLKKFDVTIDPIFNKIRSNTSQIQTLEKLRDTLLPKLMSGEVRVSYEQNN